MSRDTIQRPRMVRQSHSLAPFVGRHVEVTIFVPTDLGPTGPIHSYGRIRRVLMIVARERRYSKAIVELNEPLRLAAKESRLISAVSRSYLDRLPKLASLGRLPVMFATEASWILECGEDDPRLFSENDEAYLGFGGIHITP